MSDTALPEPQGLPETLPAAPPAAPTADELAQMERLLSFPMSLPPAFVSYMEERMRLLLTANNVLGLMQRVATVGQIKIVALDLSANTGLYLHEDAQGTWFYLNGASYTSAAYPELYAFIGTATLPDTRGRSLWLCGTHAATDLFDNDGVTESSRQPKHTHSLSGSTGSGGVTHTHDDSTAGGAQAQAYSSGSPVVAGNSGLTQTGAPTAYLHTHSLSSGSVGSGMSGSDAVAHIVLGSALIKAS